MSRMHGTVLKLLGSLMVVFCLVLAGCGEAGQDANTTKEASSASKASEQPKEKASADRAPGFEQNDVELGGVRLGMSYDEVIKLKGKPSKEEKSNVQLVKNVIFYGDNVEIGFAKDKVRYVTVSANNDWKTPAGLHVGMTLDDVEKMYGASHKTRSAPTKRPESSKNSPFYEDRWQGTRYIYSCAAPSGGQGGISWELWITNSQAKNVDAITIMEMLSEEK